MLCCQGWLSSDYEAQASLKVFIFLLQPPSAGITSKCYHAYNYILAFSTPHLDFILILLYVLLSFHVHLCTVGVPDSGEGQKRMSGPLEPQL